jgi:hypothetical protein
MNKKRTPQEIAKERRAIIDHFAARKNPARPHPAMRQYDLDALVLQGRLLKEVRREPNPNPLAGVDQPKIIRKTYYAVPAHV